jgi:hypothetical protein
VARGAHKLLQSTVGRDPLLWTVVLVNTVVVAWSEAELLWVFGLSGVTVLAVQLWRDRAARSTRLSAAVVPWWWLVTGLHGIAWSDTLLRILGFFAKAAVVVFGAAWRSFPFCMAASCGTTAGLPTASLWMRSQFP